MFGVADDGLSVVRNLVFIGHHVFDTFQHLRAKNYGLHHPYIVIGFPEHLDHASVPL